jgi:serine/threonine-protein kinase HipA
MEKERFTRVILWGKTVGFATWDKKTQCAAFQYDPEFAKSGYDVAPLMMPLASEPYKFRSLSRRTFQGLPGMLSDSLPDSYGNTLIDIWIEENNIRRTDFTPLDRLCYVGKRGIGALEYEPVIGKAYDGKIDVNMLSELAADVLRKREEFTSDLTREGLQELLSIGTSAGGARAKAVIGVNDKGEVRSGQADLPKGYSYWLIKFDTEPEGLEKKGHCRIEYAYYEMARDCGIDMTECRLLEIGKKAHFITKRFDRIGNEKVHTQTLCALGHYDFNIPGACSYADMLSLMRHLQLPYSDQEQVFRRMVFNVIMKNHDDHTKNFSFLMGKDGKWRLSPAYDLSYAFDPANQWSLRNQMTVGSSAQEVVRKDLMRFADRMNIGHAEDIIDTITSVAKEWERYAGTSGVPEGTIEKINKTLMRKV